jgi:pimeloyl-ACP methyl ester carboxylesterase
MNDYQLDIRGARLHVRAGGAGPALLWAHGLLSSVEAEQRAGKWRIPPPCRLLRYDARGHGQSSACASAADAGWDKLAGDMLGLADAHGLERFCAGGVSMGAATALLAALAAPQRVRRLLLVAPPVLWEARAQVADQYRRMARADPRVIEKMLNGGLGLPHWLRRARPVPLDSASLAGAAHLYLGAAESNLPPRAALARLAGIPAVIVGWEGDAAHPLASALELQRLLPGARLHVLGSLAEYRALPAVVSPDWWV